MLCDNNQKSGHESGQKETFQGNITDHAIEYHSNAGRDNHPQVRERSS